MSSNVQLALWILADVLAVVIPPVAVYAVWEYVHRRRVRRWIDSHQRAYEADKRERAQ